jgi:hypothetical protein
MRRSIGEAAMILDSMLHVVICHDGKEYYCPERKLSDMTFAMTVNDIAAGQFEGVAYVYEFATSEKTAPRDVTEDIAWAVSGRFADTDEELEDWAVEFIQCHLGMETANSFRRAA